MKTGYALLLIPALAFAPAAAPPPAPRPSTAVAVAVADSFPHARHGRVFTGCSGCHAGIPSGDSATMRPTPDLCAGCHDGSLLPQVAWTRRPPRPSNLHFDHQLHGVFIEASGDSALPCARCHAASDSAPVMEVGRPRPERCLGCHAPEAPSHLAQEACLHCHVPLAEASGLAAATIAAFPKPPSHDSVYVLAHAADAADSSGAGATCATCHAREFCASCHVNASRIEAITSLPSDRRVAALMRDRRWVYPKPSFHEAGGFIRVHGLMARADVSECSNCHARESCLGCHRAEERVQPVTELARRVRGGARGVDLAGFRPPDHAPDHLLRHRAPAAGGDASCSRCHAPTFCASCHDSNGSPRYHGGDFVQRHAQSAFTRENDCATCHQTAAFCRSCHRTTGRSGTGAPVGRFHDAQPNWVFGHGAVARRAIESCASCHAQNDCLRCHSASLGWRVNPHGPGFNQNLEGKNPAMCRLCHVGGPPRQ